MPRREKYPQGKRALYVYIDLDLYNKLREIAFSQSDKNHGALSTIVEDALRLYFTVKNPPTLPRGEGEGTHTHKQHKNVFYNSGSLEGEIKIKDKFNNVLTAYRKIMNYTENDIICEIRESDLVRAITLAIGTDERTIRSWVKKFLENKLLRKISEKTYIPESSVPYCVQEEDKQ
jgi:hypothetical protein